MPDDVTVLCKKLIATEDPRETGDLARELRRAMRHRMERVRTLAFTLTHCGGRISLRGTSIRQTAESN